MILLELSHGNKITETMLEESINLLGLKKVPGNWFTPNVGVLLLNMTRILLLKTDSLFHVELVLKDVKPPI